MAITYSFPVVIKNLPAAQIPYDDAERKLSGPARLCTSNASNLAIFRSECALHIILLDCVNIIQDNEYINPVDAQSTDRVEACYSRLRSWWYSRPSTLDPDKHPSQVHLLCA